MTDDQRDDTGSDMNRRGRYGRCWSLVILLLLPSAAESHPVPRSETDRNVTVTWRPDGVHVLYRVEIDEYTLLTTVGNPANGFPLDPKKRVGRKDFADAYIARMREIIPDQLVGKLDGTDLKFTCIDARCDFADSAQFRFKLKVAIGLFPHIFLIGLPIFTLFKRMPPPS